MKKVKVNNNGKFIGEVLVDYDYLKDFILGDLIDTDFVYYEVQPNESLKSIIIGYQTDPDKIKDLTTTILRRNHITNISSGDIIRLVGVPKEHSLRNNNINVRIHNIKEQFASLKEYFETHLHYLSDKQEFILEYLEDYLRNDEFVSINSLEQFEKRLSYLNEQKLNNEGLFEDKEENIENDMVR